MDSLWVTDLKVAAPTKSPVTMNVQGTPRGQPYNAADPSITQVIAPGTSILLQDIYTLLHGAGSSGVDRLLVTFKDLNGNAVANLPLSHRVYNLAGEGKEFGATMPTFDPANGYFDTGTLLGGFVGKAAERMGVLVNTPLGGATIEWTYTNSAGMNKTVKSMTYGEDGLYQTSLTDIIGFDPEPDGVITGRITAGKARVLTTLSNNATNDPSSQELTPWPEPTSDYDITLRIYVNDNGASRLFSTTHPSEEIVKRVWQINNIASMVGNYGFVCDANPAGPQVDTLPEVIKNYGTLLTPDQQQEFSGNRNGFIPFGNDSDADGLPCDADEPDHQNVWLIELDVLKR